VDWTLLNVSKIMTLVIANTGENIMYYFFVPLGKINYSKNRNYLTRFRKRNDYERKRSKRSYNLLRR